MIFKDEENQMAEDEAENSGSNKIVFSFLQDWLFLSANIDTVSWLGGISYLSRRNDRV